MANYNVKYRGQFRDVDDILWTVDILKQETVSEIEEITLADPPVNIEYQQEDVFQPLKCSAATIRVLTPKILDIYTGKIDVKIQIYKNNVLFWEGWNTPNIYSSEYSTDLDLIEINAIDNIAALEYSKYNCKSQINVLQYSIQDFINAQWEYPKDWSGVPYLGGIEISKIKVSKNPANPNFINIEFTFSIDGVATDAEFHTSNMESWIIEFGFLGLPVTVVYDEVQDALIFSAPELYDITDYPYTQRTTDYHTAKVTIEDILTRLSDKDIIYYSENDLAIEDIYINEDVFLDEDDEPLSNKEVLEQINRYLGTTMYQWGDKYYMVDIINYHKALLCGYSTTFKVYHPDGTQSTIQTTLTIPEMVVSENNSQINYGDIYNQITVQAKLDVDNRELAGDLFEDLEDAGSQIYTTTNHKYEVIGQLFGQVKEGTQYDTSTAVFDATGYVDSMDSSVYSLLQWVNKSAGWDKNLLYPHPSYQQYFKTSYSNPTIDTTFSDLKKRIATNIFIYKEPLQVLTFKTNKEIDFAGSYNTKHLVISGRFYLAVPDEPAPYINPEVSTKYRGTLSQNGLGILDFLWAKVQIGEKYWNGSVWTTTPSWFTIGIGGETINTNEVKSDTWYDISDTTYRDSKLQGWSIPLTTGAFLQGQVTITFGIPQYYTIEATYQVPPETVIKWDEFFKNQPYPFPFDTSSIIEWQINGLNIGAVYVDNVSASVDVLGEDENLNSTDISYSQEIDNTLVQSKDDITMLLNTYDSDICPDISSSYTLADNHYIWRCSNYGLLIRPEQHVVHKYCNYYQRPKLIASNTFYMNQVESLDVVKMPYLDNYYMVGNIEYDLRYKQVNITGYEI